MNQASVVVQTLSRKPDDIELLARSLEQPDYQQINTDWFAANPILTTYMNVFSIYIPRGEKFFIKSVRYFEEQINDPVLRDEVKTFIKQEANHYKAHDVFNHGLESRDVRSLREEKAAEKLFSFMEKYLPKKVQLGITVFDEHITASGAKLLLEHEKLAQTFDPEMRKLWEWHAVEEIEHKSVAYDVYQAMGAGYFHRMFSAFLAVAIQGAYLVGSENRLMKERGVKRFSKEGKQAGRILSSRLKLKKVSKEFLLYFKPGFHPWDIDDRPFVKAWYARNPEYQKV